MGWWTKPVLGDRTCFLAWLAQADIESCAGPDLSTISVDSALQNTDFAAYLLTFKTLAND